MRSASHRLLALDYDGTLAPFRVSRTEAVPLDGIPELLDRLAVLPGTTAALVSGRPLAELVALTGELSLTMAGSHGWEFRRADGTRRRITPGITEVAGLDRAEREGRLMGHTPRIERKIASVAVHTRGLAVSEARAVEETVAAAWSLIAERFRLQCRRFNGGVELRVGGRDKGTILSQFVAEAPAGTLPVYVGDDETDEDAFRAVAPIGFGFKVGEPDAATRAAGRLADIEAVRDFLATWIECAAGDEG